MTSLKRPRLFAGAALLLLALGASLHLGSAKADDQTAKATSETTKQKPTQQLVTRLAGRRPAAGHGAVPDRCHEGRRQVLDEGVRGLEPARAEGQLLVDPGRPDRGERLRRRETATWATALPRTARVTTRSTSPRSSRPTSTAAPSTRRSPAARRATGGRSATSRSRTSSRTSTAIRSRTSSVSSSSTAGRSRRWRSSSRPTATPARGPTAPTRRTVSKTVTCRRRSTPPSPSATSTPAAPAITARPSSARKPGTAASSQATRRRAASTWTVVR